jgi:hypothetical protein
MKPDVRGSRVGGASHANRRTNIPCKSVMKCFLSAPGNQPIPKNAIG